MEIVPVTGPLDKFSVCPVVPDGRVQVYPSHAQLVTV